jgi:glycerol-1-phosphate dehydrogenase [NAD(P)+]
MPMPPRDALAAVDPADVPALEAALADADPDGRLRPVRLRRIVIDDDALSLLVEEVAAVAGGPSLVLLGDTTPMRRGGENLKPLVADRLRSRFTVTEAWLGSPGHDLHADEATIAAAEAAVQGAHVVVSVGSGTVTDVAKDVTSRGARPPLVAVQTAASVNGFADDMSVLLRSGAKRTVPSRAPDVLLVDLAVLASAPAAMNVAGLGDLMAVWTAPADWCLAGLTGMDPSYHPAPAALVRDRVRDLLDRADGIPGGDPRVLHDLAAALTVSGLSMSLAGVTSPSSGSEHVVSHLVDMAREQSGTPLAFHGAQVGVAAVVVAAAWELALEQADLVAPGADPFPSDEAMEPRVRRAFDAIDPSGRVADECWAGYRAKLGRWRAGRAGVDGVLAAWPEHRDTLRSLVAPPEAIARALACAGAPARFADLEPAVDGQLARWALANAHLMRDRFSVLDLLAFAGRWDDAAVDRVLARAAAAGGGL